MSDNPRPKSKGFWDSGGHSDNGQASGRPSGFPGARLPKKTGVRTDIEFPEKSEKPRGA